MRRLFYAALLLIFPAMAYSQSNSLVSDQNPRYQESQDHYMKLKDSLTALHGTTVQHTYKAYDWREEREKRRQQRREWRHEERLYNSYYSDYYGYGGYYQSANGGYYPYSNYSYYSPSYYRPYHNYYHSYGGYGGNWRSGLHVGVGYSW